MPDLQFLAGMEAEHCSKYGHDKEFTSSNYKITTTPQHEWNTVVRPNHEPMSDTEMQHGRVVRDVDKLVESDVAKKAGLRKEEVIALVLYTGPMVSGACVCVS